MPGADMTFDAGERLGRPTGDESREAVASLRGYAYQLYASALAWLRLQDEEVLFLEVAEDYAVAARGALAGVQVKNTAGSRSLTIRSTDVATSIDAFVDLVHRNPLREVTLRHLTTSPVGMERALDDRLEGGAALTYWRRAANGVPAEPLRALLDRLDLRPGTHDFIRSLDDQALRDRLLRRIRWDAGQEPLEKLAEQLEAGLIEFASSALRLGSDVARQMTDRVLVTVLKTSAQPGPSNRWLRRANLIELGESIGRVSLPRSVIEELLGTVKDSRADRETLLVPGNLRASSAPVAPRSAVIAEVTKRLSSSSLAVVTGGTGMGKTHIAERSAQARGGWLVGDFRDVSAAVTASRLRAALGEASASPAATLLLDDLDCIEDRKVQTGVADLVGAMRRRDGAVVVTCASPPTSRTLDAICASAEPAIEIPYLTIEEVGELVDQAGGPTNLAKLIMFAGAGGHPQLVQAAILHMKTANWSRGAIRTLLGGEARDLVEERRQARDRLVTAMPAAARGMLSRASLVIGRFTRKLALALADVEPVILEPGVEVDRLIGPWVERLGTADLRVSPLVANAGAEALSAAEQLRVHRAVADHILRSRRISVLQGDALLLHALAGGDVNQLAGYAHSLVTTSSDMLELLARHSPAVVTLETDAPIVPADPFVSALLRLGQLLVALSGEDSSRAREVWSAMRNEMNLKERAGAPPFEVLLLAKVLLQVRITQAIPEWFDLMLRFDELCQTNDHLKLVSRSVRGGLKTADDIQAFAFIHQATSLRSSSELRAVFERLATVDVRVRDRLLGKVGEDGRHLAYVVNAAWLKSVRGKRFDPEEAIADYQAMAALAQRWGDRELAARCHVVVSIMLDEYAKAPSRALDALAEAERRLGRLAPISRARARVHWGSRDHVTALAEMEALWRDPSADRDGVERGFLAREAAISAAETGRWAEARTWFVRARESFLAHDSGILPVMCVGLIADAAQAALKAGAPADALDGYARAIEQVQRVNPASSLQAGYCHRVVRHAVLWLMRETRGEPIDFEETVLPPGACSNPDPNEAILERPLGSLDMAWYILADAALDLGFPAFFLDMPRRLADGPILALEVTRLKRLADYTIGAGDTSMFVDVTLGYAAPLACLEAEKERMLSDDFLSPIRGEPTRYGLDGTEPAAARRGAIDMIICFGILRALGGEAQVLQSLPIIVSVSDTISIQHVIDIMSGAESGGTSCEELTANIISQIALAGTSSSDPDMSSWLRYASPFGYPHQSLSHVSLTDLLLGRQQPGPNW